MRPFRFNYRHYFGDYIACPLNDDSITDSYVFSINLILIM